MPDIDQSQRSIGLTFDVKMQGRRSKRVTVHKPVITIGSSDQCDLSLDGPNVTSTHAKIYVYRNYAHIEEQTTDSMIFVGGSRVTGKQKISSGSTITLGIGGPTVRLIGDSQCASTNATSQVVGERPNRFPLILCGIIGFCFFFLAVAASIGVSGWLIRHKLTSHVVTSKGDEDKLAHSVALVINGYEYASPQGRRVVPLSTGTAFSVTSDGYLLTNNHVLEEDEDTAALKQKLEAATGVHLNHRIWTALGGQICDASIVYVDPEYDLGILRIDQSDLPYFPLSKSDKIPRATSVFAVGFPAATSDPVSDDEAVEDIVRNHVGTAEIKSHFKARDFDFTLNTGAISKVTRESNGRSWITHDTGISGGNSGGPLCLENGVVVGINTMVHQKVSGVGNSLAIPQLRAVIDRHVPNVTWIDP